MIIFQAKLKRFFGPYRTTLKIGESEILDHVAGVQYLPIGQWINTFSVNLVFSIPSYHLLPHENKQ